MSDVEWDADDFEPIEPVKAAAAAPAVTDKWDGEDEEEPTKDNWDDEEEEEKDDSKTAENGDMKATQVKKKKVLKDRIAEKEAKRKAELEEKRKRSEEATKELTPEEREEEKIRQRQIQEESELELAKQVFGVSDGAAPSTIDSFSPSTKSDFEEFEQALKTKISKFETSPHYVSFLETLFRDLSLSLEVDDLRKLGSSINVIANEKQRIANAAKGKKKGKQKATLQVSKENTYDDYMVGGDVYDDFI